MTAAPVSLLWSAGVRKCLYCGGLEAIMLSRNTSDTLRSQTERSPRGLRAETKVVTSTGINQLETDNQQTVIWIEVQLRFYGGRATLARKKLWILPVVI